MSFTELGNYGANLIFGSVPTSDSALRAMTPKEQMDRDMQMWPSMRQAEQSIEMMNRMQNMTLRVRPTMTLAEWDAARAAFKPH